MKHAPRHFAHFFLMAVALSLIGLGSLSADEKPKGHQWALLIGVEKYHHASRLRYTINDVQNKIRAYVDSATVAAKLSTRVEAKSTSSIDALTIAGAGMSIALAGRSGSAAID